MNLWSVCFHSNSKKMTSLQLVAFQWLCVITLCFRIKLMYSWLHNTHISTHPEDVSSQICHYTCSIAMKRVMSWLGVSQSHCSLATFLSKKSFRRNVAAVATLYPIWPARDLNLRPTAPETNALPLDQLAGCSKNVFVFQYFTYCLLLAMLACSQFLGTSGRTKFLILLLQFVIYNPLVIWFVGNIYDNADLLNQATYT